MTTTKTNMRVRYQRDIYLLPQLMYSHIYTNDERRHSCNRKSANISFICTFPIFLFTNFCMHAHFVCQANNKNDTLTHNCKTLLWGCGISTTLLPSRLLYLANLFTSCTCTYKNTCNIDVKIRNYFNFNEWRKIYT